MLCRLAVTWSAGQYKWGHGERQKWWGGRRVAPVELSSTRFWTSMSGSWLYSNTKVATEFSSPFVGLLPFPKSHWVAFWHHGNCALHTSRDWAVRLQSYVQKYFAIRSPEISGSYFHVHLKNWESPREVTIFLDLICHTMRVMISLLTQRCLGMTEHVTWTCKGLLWNC